MVFDGRGNEYVARVETVGRGRATVRPVERHVPVREPAVDLTLGQAILKGDKMDRVVRDAVMLGVVAVQPILSARSEIPRARVGTRSRTTRWQRIATASVKQCGRAVVPTVRETIEFRALTAADSNALRLLLVEPSSVTQGRALEELEKDPRPSSASVLIGPEGGWATEEIEMALRHGFVPVTFGVRTLRADAAGVAAVAVLQFIWGDL